MHLVKIDGFAVDALLGSFSDAAAVILILC